MCEFNKEDVLILARAILEWPVIYHENIQYIGSVPEYFCNYCEAEDYTSENFKHKLDCPVLIAQDILTGCEGR